MMILTLWPQWWQWWNQISGNVPRTNTKITVEKEPFQPQWQQCQSLSLFFPSFSPIPHCYDFSPPAVMMPFLSVRQPYKNVVWRIVGTAPPHYDLGRTGSSNGSSSSVIRMIIIIIVGIISIKVIFLKVACASWWLHSLIFFYAVQVDCCFYFYSSHDSISGNSCCRTLHLAATWPRCRIEATTKPEQQALIDASFFSFCCLCRAWLEPVGGCTC